MPFSKTNSNFWEQTLVFNKTNTNFSSQPQMSLKSCECWPHCRLDSIRPSATAGSQKSSAGLKWKMPWQKPGAFLGEEKRIKHTQWLYLVGEPCGDTSSGSETALRGPAHRHPGMVRWKIWRGATYGGQGWIQTLKIRSSHAKYVAHLYITYKRGHGIQPLNNFQF